MSRQPAPDTVYASMLQPDVRVLVAAVEPVGDGYIITTRDPDGNLPGVQMTSQEWEAATDAFGLAVVEQ